MNSLSQRMKSYEDNEVLPKGAAIIRVDGKSFHSWVKEYGSKFTFDASIHEAMCFATEMTASQMQGFRLAYTQSDEATFCLTNLGEKGEGWFGFKKNKLISVTASMFTNYFNDAIRFDYHRAVFDARAFSIPTNDVANNFVWRQQDWYRNSVQLLARSVFSHKEVQNKSNLELLEMLIAEGTNWYEMPTWQKYGTYVHKFYGYFERNQKHLAYEEINWLIGN